MTTRTWRLTLATSAGKLDAIVLQTAAPDDLLTADQLGRAIGRQGWVLADGDTITIKLDEGARK